MAGTTSKLYSTDAPRRVIPVGQHDGQKRLLEGGVRPGVHSGPERSEADRGRGHRWVGSREDLQVNTGFSGRLAGTTHHSRLQQS